MLSATKLRADSIIFHVATTTEGVVPVQLNLYIHKEEATPQIQYDFNARRTCIESGTNK